MRRLVLVFLVLVVCLGFGTPVGAAATVSPESDAAGDVIDFVITVTNATQSPTNQVTVAFPSTPTVTDVNAGAPSGWTSIVYAETGPVSSVVFSSGKLAPGASAPFTLTFGPPSSQDNLFRLTVRQTYDDGSSTTPDLATIKVDPAGTAVSTTTAPESTTTTTMLPSTTTTTPTALPRKKTIGSAAGEVLIALGVAVGAVIVLRLRRRS